jgi:hypothetical protein
MASAFTPQTLSHTWDEAVRDYLVSVQATRAPKTARFYDIQLRQLVLWAHENGVAFDSFGKRHLDRYLIHRQEKGLSPARSSRMQWLRKRSSAGVPETT